MTPRSLLSRRTASRHLARSGFGAFNESTLEEARWDRARRSGRRWAAWGALLGALAGLLLFAPAAWLADAVARATQQRVLLADAQGTVWTGNAVAVLAGGAGSRDARALPGRLSWTLRPSGLGLVVTATHDCCLNGPVALHLSPGFGRIRAALQGQPNWTGQWPAAWLAGLGTPWNTVDLGGALRLVAPRPVELEWVQGRMRMSGSAQIEAVDVSSGLATLPRLGSYRIGLAGDPSGAGSVQIELSTQDGALQLSGNGSLGPSGLRLRGEASARDEDLPVLGNLLNLIGRRNGARAVISIG